MNIIAAMASNRPKECLKALQAYAGNEDATPSEWFVVTPQRHAREMAAAAKTAGATVLVEEDVRKSLSADLSVPLKASFGGFRNMALGQAAREKKNIVFLDDDTLPLNDVFRRHADSLEQAALSIGKYDGHVGGSSSTLLDLTHQLEKRQDGRLSAEEFETVKQLRLQGIPPVQRPVEHAGAVGGNLGIHWKTAREQAFVTLAYRVEDGTYAALCSGRSANPPVRLSAIVRHEKKGKADGLMDELKGDWAGNALAAWIVAQKKGPKTTWDQTVAQVRKGLLLDYFVEKYVKSGKADPELDRIRDIRCDVSQAEAEAAATAYDRVQEIWPQCWEALG